MISLKGSVRITLIISILFSVKTGNGGEHLYFKWDKEIKQTTCDKHQIDIRADGGFVIAPGSSFVEGKKYSILNNVKIITIPEELKIWLLENIYVSKVRKVTKKVKKNKSGEIINAKDKKEIEPQDEVDLSTYSYTMSDEVLWNIIDGLDNKYFLDYSDWLIFTTFMKTINRKDIWKQANTKHIPEEAYDPNISPPWNKYEEDRHWEKVNHKYINTFPLILRDSEFITNQLGEQTLMDYSKYLNEDKYIEARIKYYTFLNRPDLYTITEGKEPDKYIKQQQKKFYELVKDLITYNATIDAIIKQFFGYYMFKPTNNHNTLPDEVIEDKRYLDGDTPGSFLDKYRNRYLLVKSDTGTGKTTAFKIILNGRRTIYIYCFPIIIR